MKAKSSKKPKKVIGKPFGKTAKTSKAGKTGKMAKPFPFKKK